MITDNTAITIFKQTMPDPTEAQLASPEFAAVWEVIKTWDVNVPEFYDGYCGASGSHVVLILNALSAPQLDEKRWVWKSPTRQMLHAQDCEWVKRQQTNRYVSFQRVTIEGDYFVLASDSTVRVGWRHLLTARPVCRICGYEQESQGV